MKNILLTITGPSLTGKTELAKILSQYNFEELVSTTTRPPRKGEIEGVNYHFVDKPHFKNLVEQGKMLQHNPVGDNFYGLSQDSFNEVISRERNGVVVVAPAGVTQISQFCEKNDLLYYRIFVNNDLEVLVQRFLNRYKNDKLATDSSYSRRIIDMITVEQNDWVANAYNGQVAYDKIFDRFGPENELQIVQEIMAGIAEKTSKKKPKI